MGWFSGKKAPKKPNKVKVETKTLKQQKDDDLMNDREKLVRVAATFLANPKIENETLELKNAFLKRKGLTEAEIKKAFELYKEKIRLAQEEKELKEEIASYNSNAKTPENAENKIERAKKSGFLSLKDFKMAQLPESLFELTNLKVLIISGNPLVNLPAQLANLTNLQTLHASNCDLEDGCIPEELYAALPNLVELNIAQNHITSIQGIFNGFPNLKRVNMSQNEILSLPEDETFPESLISLNLQKNNLSELPVQLAELPDLKILKISGNNFDEDMVNEINKSGPKALTKYF